MIEIAADSRVARERAVRGAQRAPWVLIGLLTAAVLLVDGYHPYADDAGIYLAGVKKLVRSSLFGPDAPFVLAHTRLSVFAHGIAALLRGTHASFGWTILGLYLLSTGLFLVACWSVAKQVFALHEARLGGLVMAAALYALPVAGTALSIMDPYVTARSFSTPMSLLGLAAAMDRRYGRAAAWLALAVALHPLMGAYAIAFVGLAVCFDRSRPWLAVSLCAAAVVASGAVFVLRRSIPVTAAYRQAVLLPAHRFLFLGRWALWEIVGAIAPLVLFGVAVRWVSRTSRVGILCCAAIAAGTTALLIAALFVPVGGPYLLARLQVMRIDHLVYCVGMVLLGGWAGDVSRGRRRWLLPAVAVAGFGAMALAGGLEYPGSNRVEWPGMWPRNPWQQAFLWIRQETPADAVFAFDPGLVYIPGEDAQGFRVEAERSQLADDKDAGVVVVFPQLAEEWQRERSATAGMNRSLDEARRRRLMALGADWVLLPPSAKTGLGCPYRNAAVQVCRLAGTRSSDPNQARRGLAGVPWATER